MGGKSCVFLVRVGIIVLDLFRRVRERSGDMIHSIVCDRVPALMRTRFRVCRNLRVLLQVQGIVRERYVYIFFFPFPE